MHPDSTAAQSLDAQAALLPYALATFAIGLPILGWVCSYAEDRVWVIATLLIFAINWAAFYALVDRIRRNPQGRADTALRTRLHILGGLLWAVAVAQISLLGLGAGPARESLLLLATAVATVCVVFSSPNLPTLLIVAPAASASPILALYANPDTRPDGRLALAAIALAMALSLIVNRLLRGLFALAGERERLIGERAQSLIQAQKLAQSKSDLLATLSHEIRNGLNGVADVLAAAAGAGGRAAPSRDQLSAALGSTRDLVSVLNATVDSESAEAGRLQVTRTAFDAVKLARELALLNAPLAAAKSLELAIHVDDSLEDPASGAGVGDAARTRQVLSNLIDNAIKYTVRGRVEVRVELLAHDRMRLAVADTGPGLTDAELTAAFEAFSRVPRTGAGVPGAGLGLSLARRLGALMGGDVSAESALGVGSCFRLDLPFEAGAQAEGGSESNPRNVVSDRDFRAQRILVGEHDALQAAMLRTILEQLGHQVVLAQNGGRLRDLARTVEFDLVMLNGRLAETDGPAAIETIRALDGPAARAAIVAVIDGDAEEARACLEAGANSVLRRPLTVANVARTLATARRATREASSAARLAPVRKAS